MALNLIKLCVGIEDLAHLERVQTERLRGKRGKARVLYHYTRMTPKRAEELLDGGSLYWVIKGVIRLRQPIVGLDRVEGSDGKTYCQIAMSPQHILVRPTPKRPFQGWRYLKGEDAPADLPEGMNPDEMDSEMAKELAELGLL